jgi:hypothetical protein
VGRRLRRPPYDVVPRRGADRDQQVVRAAQALASGTPADELGAVLDGYAARRTTS